MARILYHRELWYHIAFDVDPDMQRPPVPDGLAIVMDDELRCGYMGQSARNKRIDDRLRDPLERGLGLVSQGHLVYDTWIRLGGQSEPNSGIDLNPGTGGGILLDSWTHPDWRGKGLHGRMIVHRLFRSAELGLIRVEGLVHGLNLHAQKAQKAAGARLLKKITITRLPGWRRVKREDCGWHELHLD